MSDNQQLILPRFGRDISQVSSAKKQAAINAKQGLSGVVLPSQVLSGENEG